MDFFSLHHRLLRKETGPQAWDRAARPNQVQFCRRCQGHLPPVTTWPLSRGCRKLSGNQRVVKALVDTLQSYGVMASSSKNVKKHNVLAKVACLQYFRSLLYILDSRISLSQLTEWDISNHLDPGMQTLLTFPYCPASVIATNLPD
jgi:hypothetical protein